MGRPAKTRDWFLGCGLGSEDEGGGGGHSPSLVSAEGVPRVASHACLPARCCRQDELTLPDAVSLASLLHFL